MLLQGFACLYSYARHRSGSSSGSSSSDEVSLEVAYNLGRAAHQIGLLHVAEAYYNKVLKLSEIQQQQEAGDQSGGGCQAGETYGIQREAAYNLSLIYQGSGAQELARKVVRRYLRV